MIKTLRRISFLSVFAAAVGIAVFVRDMTMESPPDFSGAFRIVKKTAQKGEHRIVAQRGDMSRDMPYAKWFFDKAAIGDDLNMTLQRDTIMHDGKHVATYFRFWVVESILCGGSLVSLLACLAWLPRPYLERRRFPLWIAGLAEFFSVIFLCFSLWISVPHCGGVIMPHEIGNNRLSNQPAGRTR
jgi:hypothetical protein